MTQGGDPERNAAQSGTGPGGSGQPGAAQGGSPWAYEQHRGQYPAAGGYPAGAQGGYPGVQGGYQGGPGGYPGAGYPQGQHQPGQPGAGGYQPTSPLGGSGYPAPPGGPQAPSVTGRRAPGLGVLAVLAVVIALVAALGGGLVGAALTSGSGGSSTMTVAAENGQAPPAVKGSVQEVAQKVLPSVVSIEYAVGQQGDTGSGVILTKDGLILTNNHVIDGEGTAPGGAITVTFADGSTATATIKGADAVSDLAVLKVDRTDLTPIVIGDSSKLAVGQDVVAVGAPLGLSGTVTSGIVSALNRPVATSGKSSDQTTVIDSIQTDAAINPGNSGGALVNMNGELIGINSAIASMQGQTADGGSQQSGSIGLGFAIPSNQVKRISQQLIDEGKATHAALGVTVEVSSVSAAQPGAVISSVSEGGAAARAGIPKGAAITKVNDLQIPDGIALIGAVRSYAPGATVNITYTVPGGGGSKTAEVTLDTLK